jgi:hypothetical protein
MDELRAILKDTEWEDDFIPLANSKLSTNARLRELADYAVEVARRSGIAVTAYDVIRSYRPI